MKRILAALIALPLLWPTGLMAETTAPDPATNPVLASIQAIGAKFYYLGKRDSLDGWLIVKNGQIQIAYSTPENKSAVVGALFGPNGENVTAVQIATLIQNNDEVREVVTSAQRAKAGQASLSGTSLTTTPSTPLSRGEQLVSDLSSAATIIVGTNPSSVELLMVMDPNCPHCRATWRALRDVVMKGNMHIRMIPIGVQGSDNERAAAVLLETPNPLDAWDKYVSGDKTQLAGEPSAAALAAVRANHALINKWSIEDTPYLVYRDVTKKIKIIKGEPAALSPLFADLGL